MPSSLIALAVTLATPAVASAGELGDAFEHGVQQLFMVSYTERQSQALELKCVAGSEGSIDCKGIQLFVTKSATAGECSFRQWPVHGLPLAANGDGRWRALLPSKLCPNYATVYVLERQGKYRWQLTVEAIKTGDPKDAVEARCSSSTFPARTVFVEDFENRPKPADMECSKVLLSP